MSIRKLLIFPVMASLFFVATAKAQEIYDVPAADTSVSYSFFRMGEGNFADGSNLPLGWKLSFGGNATNWLALVADFSGHYGDRNIPGIVTDDPDFFDDLFDASSDVHTFQVGPRFFWRGQQRFVPYGHLLFGFARIHTDSSDFVFVPPEFRETQHPLMYTLGGGFDIHATTNVSLRALQWDYLQTRIGDAPQHYMRVSTGINFKWHR